MNRFSCDICDTNVNFEDNTVLLTRGEKIVDLCPTCSLIIQDHVKNERNQFENQEFETKVPEITIDDAKAILEKAGYVIYKKRFGIKK